MPLRKPARDAPPPAEPQLGLHSAAQAGNIGLLKYALSHGQPVTSALDDGLLPLHAAAAGGSLQAAQLLLDAGADPNAARSGGRPPGATPLHFAAAHGHTELVLLLLKAGARPERADKAGVSPAQRAREAGWSGTADALDAWAERADADLRARVYPHGASSTSFDDAPEERPRRLAVQRSIDNVFGRLRSSSTLGGAADDFFAARRPSLPDASLPPTPPSSKRKTGGTARTSSDDAQPRKLAGKLSVLSLFRKPSTDALGTPSPSQEARARTDSDAGAGGRPGILRQHARSSSGAGTGAPPRLRFDRTPSSNASPPPATASPTPITNNNDEEEDEEEDDFGNLVASNRTRSRSVASTASAAAQFPFSIETAPDAPAHGIPGRARDDSASTAASGPLVRTPPAAHAPPPAPLELDPREQIAALVQRRQASVLALNGTRSDEGQEIEYDAGEEGRDMPLSARLAAYGESLAMKRRLEEEEERRRREGGEGGGMVIREEEGSGWPTQVQGTARRVKKDGRRSSGSGPRAPHVAARLRRPHTAESATSTSSGGFLAPPSATAHHHHHQRSRSAAPAPAPGVFADDSAFAKPRLSSGTHTPSASGAHTPAAIADADNLQSYVFGSPDALALSDDEPPDDGLSAPGAGDLFGLKPGALARPVLSPVLPPAPPPPAARSSSSLGTSKLSASSSLGPKAGGLLGSAKPSLASIRDAKGSYAPTAPSIAASFVGARDLGPEPPLPDLERVRRGRMAAQEFRRRAYGGSAGHGADEDAELDEDLEDEGDAGGLSLARMLTQTRADDEPPAGAGFGYGLARVQTAPDGADGVRRANKLARMGIMPAGEREREKEREREREKGAKGGGWVRRWVGGLKGRA